MSALFCCSWRSGLQRLFCPRAAPQAPIRWRRCGVNKTVKSLKPGDRSRHLRTYESNSLMPRLSYISAKAAVKESSIHGRGLFAIEPISKGEIVCIKGGHIFNREALEQVAQSIGPAEIQITDDLF